MKIIGLLSGGKDSCYNLLHCVRQGHDIVAVASLSPPNGQDEMDSYMYQTVGQDAIEVVASALDLPLVRRIITGSAIQQASEYGSRHALEAVEGDETEDMYQLLVDVKERFPEVQGVSVGAILSNYQRVRVEHVCRRLGLTVLAYLWQRNQEELLSEMVDSGMNAVLIKVAGIGLNEKHLGRTLGDMQPILLRLNKLYGAHVCGEGGEYETLTLDCPLFKSRIVLEDVENVITSSDGVGVVAYMRIKRALLHPKSTGIAGVDCPVPDLLEENYERIRTAAAQLSPADTSISVGQLQLETAVNETPRARAAGNWLGIGGIESKGFKTVQEETRACFQSIEQLLKEHGLDMTHITHINVLISSMDHFPDVNAVFATTFGTSPPTRACVAVDLPNAVRVRMDCVANASRERQALHVQGMSYWAPANIGPYSQSIVVDNQVFVSGQIGLIPGTMQMPDPHSMPLECALSFQHADRIVSCVAAGRWTAVAHSALIWVSHPSFIETAETAWGGYQRKLDSAIPALIVSCGTIPKSGSIEVQMLYHTGRTEVVDPETGDIEERQATPHLDIVTEPADHNLVWRVTIGAMCVTLAAIADGNDLHGVMSKVQQPNVISARVFHTQDFAVTRTFSEVLEWLSNTPTTIVPARGLAITGVTKPSRLECAVLVFEAIPGRTG